MGQERKYKTLKEFYPYYLTEHQNPVCRGLHFFGTFWVIVIALAAPFMGKMGYYGFIPLVGYGFAWFGHAFFEKNKPATFQYPLFSLASDFIMFWHIATGQIGQKLKWARETIYGA